MTKPRNATSGSLCILGPGQLGQSFARHAAARGFCVTLVGKNQQHADNCLSNLLQHCGAKERNALRTSGDLRASGDWGSALSQADFVVECLPEDLELKSKAWQKIESLCQGLFAKPASLRNKERNKAYEPLEPLWFTASSSLSAHDIQQAAQVGLHLQNFHPFVPVHKQRLVEIASPEATPLALKDAALAFGQKLDFHVVTLLGGELAASRMALAQGLEAMRLLEQAVASAKDLDALLVKGYGHPCGPLELSDRIGLDLRLSIANYLYKKTGDPKFIAPPILVEKVSKGECGKKSGKGFYAW